MRYIFLFTVLFFTQSVFGQCFPDRHNTTWYDGWVSCEVSPNPNPARGESHWLHYDLGSFYKLKDSKFWNTNHPDFLQDGLQEVVIDYSLDGLEWNELGTFTIEEATGSKYYEGSDGPDFAGVDARYVLITAISNYGGTCFGLSELKINIEEATVSTTEVSNTQFSIFPNPADDVLNVRNSENIPSGTVFEIVDVLGKKILEQKVDGGGNSSIRIDITGLISGVYFLKIRKERVLESLRFVK